MPFLPNSLFGPHCEPSPRPYLAKPLQFHPTPPHHYIGKPFEDNGFGPSQKTIIHLPISNGTSPLVANSYVEWRETPTAHVYKAHVPGLRHNEVRVEVENGRELRIIGEKWVERETSCEKGQLLERARTRFVQTLMLPQDSNVNRVKAFMENGALLINVPKY
ncbi:hypothetical protein VNO78_25765 [Psophocarpus tetragonolobus]|uniref:SHSP domain-containing protein n=1 Tax=Psophocarpus tetragonolobus TaxID=3891 RepID=A0AAN9SAA5_PSOTE